MAITSQEIKRIMKQVLAEEAKKDEIDIQPIIIPPLAEQPNQTNTPVLTQDVVDSLMRYKQHKRVKEGTIKTYKKHFSRFARQYPILPLEAETILEFLDQFDGDTGRHKRNQLDRLNMLYRHALCFFGIHINPCEGLERPIVTEKPIKTLSLTQARGVDLVVQTITEMVVWELTFGHGWRQIEVRRIRAEDVLSISDGIIWCRGKEREEFTPILPETEELLKQLVGTLSGTELIIRSTRIRGGMTQSLGEDGISQLIQRLFYRADIKYLGHDLRRTFCTLVEEASGSESLAMRLARDKVPGVNDRYINAYPAKLRESLLKYSPIRLIRHEQAGEILVETGENRTPRPEEAAQNILQA